MNKIGDARRERDDVADELQRTRQNLQHATEQGDKAFGRKDRTAMQKYARLIDTYVAQLDGLRSRLGELKETISAYKNESDMQGVILICEVLIESIRKKGWEEDRPLEELTFTELTQIVLSEEFE